MMRSTVGGRFLEALLFAVSSLVLYSFGAARVLFLVPLQVMSVRRGTAGLAASAGIAAAGLAGIRLASLLGAPLEPGAVEVAGAEVALFLLLAGGLAAAGLRMGGARGVVRLLAATGGVCLAGAPIVLALARNTAVIALVDRAFADASRMLKAIFATGDSVEGTVLEALMVPATLKAMVREYVLSSFVLMVFAFLAFSWWAGSVAGARAARIDAVRRWRFASFRLESWWLWPLIGSLALVLADLLGGERLAARAWLPYVSAAAWNTVLVMLFLFGLQGLAIVRFWLEKRALARLAWPVGVAVVLVALATPRLNAVIAVALPLFGASENWVRYRADGRAAS
jgi:hypothetical protein